MQLKQYKLDYTIFCELPTPYGTFRMYDSGDENVRIITYGSIKKIKDNSIVRIHSSCIASEVFEAKDCDCADQLRETMKLIAKEQTGLIIHIHQEGRGQGLSNKIIAVHKMQNENLDTFESFAQLGLEQDIRNYKEAIDILTNLNIKNIRLVSNNPRKKKALENAGFKVKILNTHPLIRIENEDYLNSKNNKLNHYIPLNNLDEYDSIYFYHSDQKWGQFSNFSKHAIFLEEKIWKTVEHYYQAQKFNNSNIIENIRLTSGPIEAKEVATKLKIKQKENWNTIKETIMWKGLVAKFTQHPELKDLLISTKDKLISEHTNNDYYWGDGLDGSGLNRLGLLLMELRKRIIRSENLYTKVNI